MNNFIKNLAYTVLLVAVVLGAVYFINKNDEASEVVTETPSQNEQEPWKTYESSELGFSVEYPEEMNVATGAGSGLSQGTVRFALMGPTQVDGTEVFDGILFDFNKRTYADTLRSLVDADVKQTEDLGEVTEEVRQTTVDGRPAFTYKANTLGLYTHYYVDLGDKESLVISYINPDPTSKGFKDITDRMLASVRIR